MATSTTPSAIFWTHEPLKAVFETKARKALLDTNRNDCYFYLKRQKQPIGVNIMCLSHQPLAEVASGRDTRLSMDPHSRAWPRPRIVEWPEGPGAITDPALGRLPIFQDHGPLTSPSAIQAARVRQWPGADKPAPGRLKLWDIPAKYHCPLIGTCFNVDELRAIARKACGSAGDLPISDYAVHSRFVAAADNKNPLSMALQKNLERNYAAAIQRFSRVKEPTALERLWREHLAAGRVPEAFWALLSHPRTETELRQRAYEDVHMLSHQIGAGLSADIKALAKTRAALAQLREDAAAEAARRTRDATRKDERIAVLEQQVAQIEPQSRALAEAQTHLQALESGEVLARLKIRVANLESELAVQAAQQEATTLLLEHLQQAYETSCAHAETLSSRLAESEAACVFLERLLSASEAEGALVEESGPGCQPETQSVVCQGEAHQCTCGACPARAIGPLDLGGRRILCVGGRGSLVARYRDLVKRCNGELIRHDGGLEESRLRLESLLASADAVVCPADCVSHDAYLRAKRFCKRMAKPCVLIERSGISAFAKALCNLAN